MTRYEILIPEPTPEQRKRRELGPMTVRVIQDVVIDVEAFKRELRDAILSAITENQ